MEVREIGLKSLKPEIGVEKFDPPTSESLLEKVSILCDAAGPFEWQTMKGNFSKPHFQNPSKFRAIGLIRCFQR